MIEVYLFLAMFLVQILGMSVLYPVRLTRLIRTGLKSIPTERFAELYLETWGPFAGTVFSLILTLFNLRTVRLTAPPRQPEADGLGSSPVR